MYCLIAALSSSFLIKWILILYNIRFSQHQGTDYDLIYFLLTNIRANNFLILYSVDEREKCDERERERKVPHNFHSVTQVISLLMGTS